MSQVHYKFKSSKDYDSATFDGHSISVFDLKKEILIAKGLKGPDDLALTHAESGEGNCTFCDIATAIKSMFSDRRASLLGSLAVGQYSHLGLLSTCGLYP